MVIKMQCAVRFILNNEVQNEVLPAGMSTLDYLRNIKKLRGTKEGCREGDCGACTVLAGRQSGGSLIYKPANSCLLPAARLNGSHLVTIEGLNSSGLTLLQQYFAEEGASQCGYCTPGFIISLTGYFLSNKTFSIEDAADSIAGNLCRCTGYGSIKRAIEKTVTELSRDKEESTLERLVRKNIIPDYFSGIGERLKGLNYEDTGNYTSEKSKFIIAGGTDLYVRRWDEIAEAEITLIHKTAEQPVIIKDGECIIDAAATISDLMNSTELLEIVPCLKKHLSLFASMPIRSQATLGGNIANGSPIADSVVYFLPFDPVLRLSGRSGERAVRLSEFYSGYKQLDLKDGEVIKCMSFRVPEGNYYYNFEKVSKREHLDIASVNSAAYIEADQNGRIIDVRLSAGGVAPFPLLLNKTAESLTGNEISFAAVLEAAEKSREDISPISDIRGSAGYKALLLRQLIISHFITLFPEQTEFSEEALL
ncbi:MAG: FAD binding domain-containing protein [Syntrophothermus sp.]